MYNYRTDQTKGEPMKTFIEVIALVKTGFNAVWQLAMGILCLGIAFALAGFAYAIIKAAFFSGA